MIGAVWVCDKTSQEFWGWFIITFYTVLAMN